MGKPTKHTRNESYCRSDARSIDAPHGHITVQLGVGTFKEFHKSL